MMRSLFRQAVAAVCCALLFSAFNTGCHHSGNPFVIGLDLYHGRAWSGLKEEVESFGFVCRLLETPEDFSRLNELGVVMICTEGANTAHEFSTDEIKDVASFVKKGGGLLCADESWSWTMDESGHKRLKDFPLNQLGMEFGFSILDHSVGAPRNLSPKLLAGIGEISRSTWWASEIELTGKKPVVLISDERARPIMGAIEYGRGRVAVLGSADLLRENPRVLRNVFLYLAGIEEEL